MSSNDNLQSVLDAAKQHFTNTAPTTQVPAETVDLSNALEAAKAHFAPTVKAPTAKPETKPIPRMGPIVSSYLGTTGGQPTGEWNYAQSKPRPKSLGVEGSWDPYYHPVENKLAETALQFTDALANMLSFGIYDGFLGYFWASSGASGNAVQTTQAISTGSWKHVALCREGNTWNTYYDGTRVDTRTLAVTLHASTEPVYIGSYFGTANNEINGYIDELRVSDSARYTGTSYTVPTEPFQNDTNTLLLLHMNGTDGSTTFIDDNGVTTAGTGA